MHVPAAPPSPSRPHVARALLTRPAQEGHLVQFYADPTFLCEVVADYMGAGLQRGESLLVIATGPHREAFARHLRARGYEVEAACASGQLTLLDASETLATFMEGAQPDRSRFLEVIGSLLERIRARAGGAPVRAYGEMVDVLWRAGSTEAAVRLEELWNELATLHSFSLLCAYDLGGFGAQAHAQAFEHICRTHSHVIPTETYAELEEPEARLREVSLLQQRARALEAEVEHRKQVEQQLRQAISVRDEFLSIAGHELRTPLTALQLHLHTLGVQLRGEAEGPLQERLSRVGRQVRRLAQLTEQLLDVSRASAGRLTLEPEAFDLAELVREAVERTCCSASAPEVRVEAAGPVAGTWDRGRIEQVVVNLLSNALKYGEGRPIDVSVTGSAQQARLVVRDRGIGIAPELQERIFERFERAVSSRHYGGLGLGLWIAKQIVSAHRGTLRLQSAPGEGTTFIVELPLQP